MRQIWPWLCAILSGILLALSYPPVDFGGLAWVALAPLIAALLLSGQWSRWEAARLALLGYVAGFIYFLGSLQWIITVTVAGWVLLSAYLAVYPALWGLFVGLVLRRVGVPSANRPVWLRSGSNLLVAVLASMAWTATEWLRGMVFSGFGWNALGVTLHGNIALIQICDITGVGGLSFLLVLVNATIVITLKRLSLEVGRHRLRPHYDFSFAVAAVALVFAYGVRQVFTDPPPSEKVTVAAVQGNVPILEKRDPEHERRILDLHIDLSGKALLLNPDLLIWPEAATPRAALSDQDNWDVVRGIAERSGGDFLLGTVYFGPEGDFNSALLLSDRGMQRQLYHKMHLVPFGEYVPLRHSFPIFVWLMGYLVPEDFDFGREPTVLQMNSKPVKIGALICFEDTLGDLARQFAQRGAQMFVTLTNDGWFLHSAGSLQHLRQAIFRSAETKLPMVRAANTGVSCVIDSLGRIQQTLTDEAGSTFVQGLLIAPVNVPLNPRQTFYTRHGEVFSMGCLLAVILTGGAKFLRRKK